MALAGLSFNLIKEKNNELHFIICALNLYFLPIGRFIIIGFKGLCFAHKDIEMKLKVLFAHA